MKHANLKKIFLVLLTCGSLSISSCASTDYQKTVQQGGIFGGVLGAITGTGAALLVTDDPTAIVAAGVAGAGLGAAAGTSYGKSQANKKQQYIRAEDAITAQIAQVDARISQSKKSILTLGNSISSLKKQRGSFENANSSAKKSYNQHLKNQKSTAVKELSLVNSALRSVAASSAKSTSAKNKSKLATQTKQLKQQKANLEANLALINQLSV